MASRTTGPKRGRHFYGPGPYIERDADEALRTALVDGEYALVLGPRGSGKTALRIAVGEQLAKDGVDVATVDLGAIGAETRPDAFCASLLIEAGRSLGLAEEAKRAWRRSKGPPQVRLRACLREVILESRERPLVLFVDELELIRALGPARDDFFAALRAMADARGHDPVWRRLSVCLIGALTRDELISDPRRSGFDLPAREITPRDFSREQLDELAALFDPLAERVDSKALLDALSEWTSGHPALVQWICGDLLLRELARGREATAVELVIRESFLQRGPELDPLLGDTARRLRRDHRDPYRTRILAAYERVLRGDVIDLRGRQLGSEGALIVARLKVYGLVAPSAGGKLRVRNRVVERAFDRNWVRRALAGRPVSDALERWEAGGRRPGALLRGDALRDAIAWVEGRPDVTPSERDFVLASEQARSRRLRATLYAGAALSLGLAAMLGLSLWQYGEAIADAVETRVQGSEGASDVDERAPAAVLSEPSIVATTRMAVAEVAGTSEIIAHRDQLAIEVGVLADELALERVARAELLAPDASRRSEGLELGLSALEHFVEAPGRTLDEVPPPVTLALTANLPSPGDVALITAHAGPVELLRSSADGRRIATQSGRELRVWERSGGREVASLTSIAGPISELALSPSGTRVAALSEDGTLTVWNLADGSVLGPAPILAPRVGEVEVGHPLGPPAAVAALSVDDEGEVTLVRSDGSRDRVDPAAGNQGVRLESSALPSSLPLGHAVVVEPGVDARVVVVHGDLIEVWDPRTGQAQASVAATVLLTGVRVEALLASPRAAHVITQIEDSNALAIWDTARGSLRTVAEQDEAIVAIALAPGGDLLATAGDDGVARIWSVESGALLDSLAAHDAALTSIEFTADGGALLVGDRSGQLQVHPLALAGDFELPLRGAALTAGGAAATVRYDEGSLELEWSGSPASVRWALPQPLSKAAVSVDGTRVALLWADGRLDLVAGATGLEAEPLASLDGRILDFALSETGKLLAAAGEDRRISLVGGEGAAIATLAGHEAPVDRVAFSPDATRLVSADRSRVVRVWDPGTAALLGTFEVEREAALLAVSSGGVVVIDADGGGELWSIARGSRTAVLDAGEGVTAVALGAEEGLLALARRTSQASGAVELWRGARFEELGKEAVARFRVVGPVWTLRFGADGRGLVAIDGAGRQARWSTEVAAWVTEACASLAPGTVWPGVCDRE